MNTRQIHGFLYERLVIQRLGLRQNTNYTGKYDAWYNDIPIQIKCCKYKSSIDFGDFLRNQQHSEDFILIIGFWKDNKTNIVEEYMIKIDTDTFCGSIKFDYTNQMLEGLRHISNNKIDDQVWKSYVSKYKKLYNKPGRILKLRFKRDHKKQKRIQCSMNYSTFVKHFKGNAVKNFTKEDLNKLIFS